MENENSEIVKLTERIAKDPKSKLFVPLAEEYKKAGDMEMAIHVLTEGLKNNPGYVTAKAFLGRLLIEKGDLPGAQKEFEEVIKAIPDNLLAQRKLGDVYALQGNVAKAMSHYRTAQSLSPQDEEIASLITDIEAGRSVVERLKKGKKPAAPAVPSSALKPASAAKPGGAPAPKSPGHVPGPAAQARQQMDAGRAPQPEHAEVPEMITDFEPLPAAETRPKTKAPSLTGPRPDISFPGDDQNLSPISAPGAPGRIAELGAEEPEEITDISAPEMEPLATERIEPLQGDKDDFTTDTLAELYITQGFYEKAIEIYERMLADRPDSAALQEKLASVRAMAGLDSTAGPSAPPYSDDSGITMQEPAPWSPEPSIAGGPAADSAQAFADASRGTGDHATGEHRPSPEVPIGRPQEAAHGGMPGARQQTVERLEQWLSNIMKEKKR